ncbi:hypothetical protein CQ019_18000 [Arthrobacter sp. MYb229]|nr:hypothetical protein CQ019_18000 [Arthrobacter sp. MYb229]PRB46386.1 hypothetical protein CQ013_18015 [Arthrobacter sp. MYb216]
MHMAAITRMTYDEETREYVEKRRTQGKSDTETRRCIKRYLAGLVFRILTVSGATPEEQRAASQI